MSRTHEMKLATNQILCGDVRQRLREIQSDSVQCVVTSPPYYGLRSYKTSTLVWGGEASCEHRWSTSVQKETRGVKGSTLGYELDFTCRRFDKESSLCGRCGAFRGHLGLEPVHDCGAWARGAEPCAVCYICHIRTVFAEVRRVLRKDGTLWLNLGDTYSTSSGGVHKASNSGRAAGRIAESGELRQPNRGKMLPGLKPKDLMGLPWRCALALQADGWYLRKDIIWAKPNPMPESTEDRPTSAHEYLFLMSKSEIYFCDMVAVREPMTETSINRLMQTNFKNQSGGHKAREQLRHRSSRRALEGAHDRLVRALDWQEKDEYWHLGDPAAGRNRRDVWTVAIEPFSMEFCTGCKRHYDGAEYAALPPSPADLSARIRTCICGATDKWLSHFATFPQGLVEPCVLAGTSERGGCSACGVPWKRVEERPQPPRSTPEVGAPMNDRDGGLTRQNGMERVGMSHKAYDAWMKDNPARTVGWEAQCACEGASTKPCVVLDPFMGSGTVAMVALRAGREFLGIDLNEDYVLLAGARIAAEKYQKRMF